MVVGASVTTGCVVSDTDVVGIVSATELVVSGRVVVGASMVEVVSGACVVVDDSTLVVVGCG